MIQAQAKGTGNVLFYLGIVYTLFCSKTQKLKGLTIAIYVKITV